MTDKNQIITNAKEWIKDGGIVPVNMETTQNLVCAIKDLLSLVEGQQEVIEIIRNDYPEIETYVGYEAINPTGNL